MTQAQPIYLVLLETSGNQAYIFETNRLRENVGASQLTLRAGTQFVLDAVAAVCDSPTLWRATPAEQRAVLRDAKLNPPILSTSVGCEVVLATSGKALLLANSLDTARQIVAKATDTALRTAAGLDLTGAIAEFRWDERQSFGAAVAAVHHRAEVVHSQISGPEFRHLRLPVIEECRSSSWPAAGVFRAAGGFEASSMSSEQKRQAAVAGWERMRQQVGEDELVAFPKTLDELEKEFAELDWLGLVHADGNGLGSVFLKFSEHANRAGFTENAGLVRAMREFSQAIEVCTERATRFALRALQAAHLRRRRGRTEAVVPLLPLVLGGDDLTVLCDGATALDFTREYLAGFAAESLKDDEEHLHGIIGKITEHKGLSACAGVSIIKPHYPFFAARSLAEDLIGSAKQVKAKVVGTPCSALDFHVLYDSSGAELDQIRARLSLSEAIAVSANAEPLEGNAPEVAGPVPVRLWGRPIVTTALADLEGKVGQEWAKAHHWDRLARGVCALRARKADGERLLPNSQIHRLRQGLHAGRQEADARLALAWSRYSAGLADLVHWSTDRPTPTLFRPEDGGWATDLLDAMEAAEFLNA